MFLLLASGITILLIAWVTWSSWDRVAILANNGELEMAAAMYGRHAEINRDCSLVMPNCFRDGRLIQLRSESLFGSSTVGFRARMVTFTNGDGTRLITVGLMDDPSRPAAGGEASTAAVSRVRVLRHLEKLRRNNTVDAPWRVGVMGDAGEVSFIDTQYFPPGVPGVESFSAVASGIVIPPGSPVILSRMANR